MHVYIIFLFLIFFLLFIDRFQKSSKKNMIKSFNKFSFIKTSNTDFKSKINKLSIPYKLAIVILFCFSAFRFNVGWDYMAYYDTIERNIITNVISNDEFLNILIIEISKTYNITNLYFFLSTFICLFFTIITIKNYSKDVWLSLIIFICFPLFFLNSLSVVRIFSALAISFYGIKYIEKGNFIKYLITVFVASMFHKSAMIAITFYFFKDLRLKNYKVVIALFLMPPISVIINRYITIFFPRYSVYTEVTTTQEGTKAIFIFLLLGVISLLMRNRITNNDHTANIYYNNFFIGLCIYLMFFQQGTMGHRLSLFGTIYSLLLVPKIVSLFDNKKEKLFLNMLVYLLCIVFFVYTVYAGSRTYIPYKTIWG